MTQQVAKFKYGAAAYTVSLEEITPEEAKSLVSKSIANRPVKPNLTAKYRRAMENGQWLVNGEPIIILASGTVTSGQHRLRACIEADKPFATFMIRGVPDDCVLSIDTGSPKRAKDIFKMTGIPNSRLAAEIGKNLWFWEKGNLQGCLASAGAPFELMDLYRRYPSLPEIIEFIASKKQLKKFASLAVLGTCAFIFSLIDKEKALAFFDSLDSGIGLTAGSPILSLRDRLAEERRATALLRAPATFALTIKAWNAYIGNRRLKILKVTALEDFPPINGVVIARNATSAA